MGAVNVKVSVVGENTISQDYEKAVGEIRSHFPKALRNVASEMTENLQKHIEQDWYLPWGEPKSYKRRTTARNEDKDYGTPLGDKSNIHYPDPTDCLDFTYTPTGKHKVQKWSSEKDGDEIIRIIQMNSGWDYPPDEDENGRTIMPRPFWDNFVDEQAQHGIIDAFIAGMGKRYPVIPEGAGNDVVLDGDEKLS